MGIRKLFLTVPTRTPLPRNTAENCNRSPLISLLSAYSRSTIEALLPTSSLPLLDWERHTAGT